LWRRQKGCIFYLRIVGNHTVMRQQAIQVHEGIRIRDRLLVYFPHFK
jgi:hypothetical protein